MPYAYYSKLARAERAVYRASERVSAVSLPAAASLAPCVDALERALASGCRREVLRAVVVLGSGVCTRLDIAPLRFTVRAARPSDDWGELHGEYVPAEGRRRASITLWMRTAKHKNIVAFRTFLRTLLHELCHHIDYELFELADSFHTEGFFKREASLFNQLVRNVQPAAASD